MTTKTSGPQRELRTAQYNAGIANPEPILAVACERSNPTRCRFGIADGQRTTPCPICGKQSAYTCYLDRYVHFDGSANLDCWIAMLRGDA